MGDQGYAEPFGLKVAPGEIASLGDEDEPFAYHCSQVALGDKPVPGRHTIYLHSNGGNEKWPIGTLEAGRCEQFQVDFMAKEYGFSHSGKSDVYITGYQAIQEGGYSESDDEFGNFVGSDEDEDIDSEDEEMPANGLGKGIKKLAKRAADEDDDSEDDDEDDSDDDDEGIPGEDFSDMSEDDEDDDAPVPKAVPIPKGQGKRAASEPEAAAPSKKAKSQAGLVPKAATPVVPVKPVPVKSSPAAKAGAPADGNAEFEGKEAYLKALVTFIEAHPKQGISRIGGVVKKPNAVPKLKKFLLDHPKIFKVEGEDVSLVK